MSKIDFSFRSLLAKRFIRNHSLRSLNSVSSLGDSTGRNVASGGRRALGERLTMLSSFPEKSESPPPEEESNVKRIFKAFAKKPSDAGADASDGAAPNRQKESMLLGNDDSRSHVGK